MKQIRANSVGSVWRADVFNAAQHGPVEVIDLDGKRLGIVHRTSPFRATWNAMHKWSDIIAAQNTRNYRAQIGGKA